MKILSNLISFAGERYTVVINANQAVKSYWIHVRAIGLCTHTAARQVAILHYAGAPSQPSSPIPRFNVSANANTRTLVFNLTINSYFVNNVTIMFTILELSLLIFFFSFFFQVHPLESTLNQIISLFGFRLHPIFFRFM